MTSRNQLLIITDLDATLLTEDYSYEAALPAINELKRLSYPIILNSSKTLAELKSLALELELNAPVIAENGGHIAYPTSFFPSLQDDPSYEIQDGYFTKINGLSRRDILKHAHALRDQYGYEFYGFSDWTVEQISAHTGLTNAAAAEAKDRYVTEPILWNDTQERFASFLESMENIGARALLGGRFIHLMGAADKADGLNKVKSFYEEKSPQDTWIAIALGDSPNDQDMLNASDIAVIIPHQSGARLTTANAPQVIKATQPASTGWNEAILTILKNSTFT